jgi:hypothetical protein
MTTRFVKNIIFFSMIFLCISCITRIENQLKDYNEFIHGVWCGEYIEFNSSKEKDFSISNLDFQTLTQNPNYFVDSLCVEFHNDYQITFDFYSAGVHDKSKGGLAIIDNKKIGVKIERPGSDMTDLKYLDIVKINKKELLFYMHNDNIISVFNLWKN